MNRDLEAGLISQESIVLKTTGTHQHFIYITRTPSRDIVNAVITECRHPDIICPDY
jgi:hypothetical protein